LLGEDHPLVRALDVSVAVRRHSRVAVTALGVGLIGVAVHVSWATALVAGAAGVLVSLVAAGALLRRRRSTLAIALIAEGREDLPLAPVERERERLLSRRTRSTLARSLEGLVREAANPPALPGPPLFDYAIIRGFKTRLCELALLLRSERSRARGVALVWRLISEGATSPLHGNDTAQLHQELERIRFLLMAE